jgi:hypothetical protein
MVRRQSRRRWQKSLKRAKRGATWCIAGAGPAQKEEGLDGVHTCTCNYAETNTRVKRELQELLAVKGCRSRRPTLKTAMCLKNDMWPSRKKRAGRAVSHNTLSVHLNVTRAITRGSAGQTASCNTCSRRATRGVTWCPQATIVGGLNSTGQSWPTKVRSSA